MMVTGITFGMKLSAIREKVANPTTGNSIAVTPRNRVASRRGDSPKA